MFRKTPETFYIRNDRHSGASMAIRDSDSDHDNYSYYVRADNSSSTSSVRPVPVDQIQDRRDGYDQSVQRRYYPATHRLRTVEYREDDATTTHFYPPSEFSGTEIRNSFKFVDRNREFRPNDPRGRRVGSHPRLGSPEQTLMTSYMFRLNSLFRYYKTSGGFYI